MGYGKALYVADLQEERAKAECSMYNISLDKISTNYHDFLQFADVVDVVTPTDTHYSLCLEALHAGKDVFVEKPMTLTSREAEDLAKVVHAEKRILQVGYYYRFHPAACWIKEQVKTGALGRLRYLSGSFMGFKRARTDVGVTHTDGVHFLDLFNWFVGRPPKEVYAVTRDHFHRGLEDFSIVICTYPEGEIAKVESGYIQPGKWGDKVVPSAWTTKEVSIVGSMATVEADFEIGEVRFHDVHHELRNGVWTALHQGSTIPPIPAAGPIEQLCDELKAFMNSVKTRTTPLANAVDSGLNLAKLMDAVYQSGEMKKTLSVNY